MVQALVFVNASLEHRTNAVTTFGVVQGGARSAQQSDAALQARVVLAEPDDELRQRLLRGLRDCGFRRCISTNHAVATVAVVATLVVQLVVMSTDLPGDGFQTAADITGRDPAVLVVLMTDDESDDELVRALRVGARGYLRKDMSTRRFAAALRGALMGEAALSRVQAAHLIDEFRARDRRECLRASGGRGERLTLREWDVLELMERGLRTAEIADCLYVTKVTVRSHVASIVHKLDVPDREAAIHLLRRGSYA